jgi:hypothetical protein
VRQAVRPKKDVAVDSEEPKFSPDIVSEALPLNTPFDGNAEVNPGASKVKVDLDVPTAPLTVTLVRDPEACTPEGEHSNVVGDVHAVV